MINATTIIIAITVDKDHGDDSQHIGDRIAAALNLLWQQEHLPPRMAQDIRVLRHDASAIGDMLNKAALGEEPS